MKTARSIRGFGKLLIRINCILLPALLAAFPAGCASSAKPHLSVDAQAEALSHFSLGLLAEAGGDSPAALEHFAAAVRLDPNEEKLYAPAVGLDLKLQRTNDAVRLARELMKRHPDSAEPALLLARVYALTEQPGQAEALFKKAAVLFPDHPDGPVFMARFYIAQERRADAIEALRTALIRQPGNAELLHLLGTLCVDRVRELGDTPRGKSAVEEGIVFLRKALELRPDDPLRWQQLGYALLAVKQPEEALKALEEAHQRAPGELMIARQMMDLMIQSGQFEKTLSVYEKLAEETGTDPEPWLKYMAEQMPEDQCLKLIEHLEEQIRQHPAVPVFYHAQLGALYLGAQKYVEAERVLRKALEFYPDDTRLSIVLGYIHLQSERYEEAYTVLEQVHMKPPGTGWPANPFFIVNFLVAAQKSGHFEEASATLASTYTNNPGILDQYMRAMLTRQSPVSVQSAIQLLDAFHTQNPEVAEALYYLSVLQAEQKQYETALNTTRQFEALAQKSGSTNLLGGSFYFQYASLYERTGQLEEAEKLFFKAIELGNGATAASARNYVAYMWAERGEKLDMGLKLIQQALADDPENGAFLDTLGWIYYMQGRYAEALNELQKARSFYKEDSTVWEHLGDTYLKLGNRDAAIEHWKKALEFEPGSRRLIERLEANGIRSSECPESADNPADTLPRP